MAWFGEMRYQTLQLVVTQGIDALLHQYLLSGQGCEVAQGALLHEYVLQFQVSIILLWSMYHHAPHGDQWLSVYIEQDEKGWFPRLFRGQHVE